jgi:3-oxoacyl-[acyl-carrier protein] reductase
MENNMNDAILITGSNGGIGSGVTKYLLKNGIRNLACHYKSDSSSIVQVLKEFDLDPSKHTYQADLTNEEQIIEMRDKINDHQGPVSSVINIAGSSNNSMSWKLSKEDFLGAINNNLLTTFLTCKTFIPSMRELKFGRIINISSIVGFTGVAGASHYCAAKAGIVGFSKSISHELVNKNITVNTLALGYFNTGIINEVPEKIQEIIKSNIPAKRFGEVNEVASMIKFLLSDDASYITGQVHHINGGLY